MRGEQLPHASCSASIYIFKMRTFLTLDRLPLEFDQDDRQPMLGL